MCFGPELRRDVSLLSCLRETKLFGDTRLPFLFAELTEKVSRKGTLFLPGSSEGSGEICPLLL